MFGLLCFPDFDEPFVTRLPLANLAPLRVKIFEPPGFCVRRTFDGPLLRHERYLIICVLVCRTVKDRTDSIANSHIVCPPPGIEQDALAAFTRAISKEN